MISIPTIQCELCVERKQAAVKKVEGIESVNIDLREKKAHAKLPECCQSARK